MTNTLKFFGLVFLCLAWGINWVAIKISLEGLPPMFSASFRFFLAIIILFFYIKGKRISLKLTGRELRLILVTGVFMYLLDYGLIYWGEQYLSAGVTSIFFSTFALFTALFSNFVFRNEAFRWDKFAGLLVGFAGILVVFYDQLEITRFDLMVTLASGAIILSAVFAALATVIVKKYLSHMNPVPLSFYQTIMGTFFLALLSVMTENVQQIHLSMNVFLAVIYMGAVSSAIAFVVYYKLLKQMSAVSLSFIIYIIPIVALVADFVFYKQVLPIRSFVGMVIIFSGIWLSRQKRPAT